MTYILFAMTLLGFFFPKSKKCEVIQIVGMMLLYGGYNGQTDLGNYRWQFANNWVTDWRTQRLFSYIMMFFHKLGTSFELYHIILTLISVLILVFVIRRLTSETAYVLSIISCFVYIEFGWQLKTLLATSVVAVAICWFFLRLYEKKWTFFNVLVYILLIFAAIQIHYMSLFFIILLFLPFLLKHISIVLVLDVLSSILLPSALLRFSQIAGSLEGYLSHISPVSFAVTVCWQLIGTWIILHQWEDEEYLAWTYDAKITNGYDDEFRSSFRRFVIDGTKGMLILLPFYYYANVATRIYHIWVIFEAIYISYFLREYQRIHVKRIMFDAFVMLSTLFWYDFLFRIQGALPLIQDLFSNNIINGLL